MPYLSSDGRAVRPSVAADLPSFKSIIAGTGLFPPDLLDDMIAPYLLGEEPCFWLTLDEGGPVGFAYCAQERFTDGTWNLLLIAVDPARHRNGRGADLIGAVAQDCVTRSGRILLVETSGLDSFAGQQAFYLAQDFEQEARIRDFYQAGEDKIVFWKRLDDG